jgi:glutamate N-acetyltransferase/amino-acid N-acetyltransferase
VKHLKSANPGRCALQPFLSRSKYLNLWESNAKKGGFTQDEMMKRDSNVKEPQPMHDNRAGSITTPVGFQASAVACGLKASGKPDLALIVSDQDCTGAATFTRNCFAAAPVIIDRETLAANSTRLRAIVANAGIANACTGDEGLEAAREMQRMTSKAIGCSPEQTLVLSTGVIGVQLDLDKIAAGISMAASQLDYSTGLAAAKAIMTTDTRPKSMALRLSLPAGEVTIGGIAKGSGMIHPNMATVLAVLTTDAAVPEPQLTEFLADAVEQSFNRISVDGDTSTNDTVLLLANGASGIVVDDDQSAASFALGLKQICIELAKDLVRDGEGASRFISIRVEGARTEAEATQVARTIATSPLVKTALAGGDPNWGRILAAAGRAGPPIHPEKVDLWIGAGETADLQLVQSGSPSKFAEEEAARIFHQAEIYVLLKLGDGEAGSTVWTCDLTQDYVTINSDYRT